MIGTEKRNFERTQVLNQDSVFVKPLVNVDTGLFLLRLVLGVTFVVHGSQKVFGLFGGHGLEGTVAFMGTLGIPAFLAYIAIFTEFFGGLAVLGGLLARPAALGLAITMLVAIFKVHLGAGFFAPNGFEYPLSLAVISITIFLLGAGRYSIDNKIFNRK